MIGRQRASVIILFALSVLGACTPVDRLGIPLSPTRRALADIQRDQVNSARLTQTVIWENRANQTATAQVINDLTGTAVGPAAPNAGVTQTAQMRDAMTARAANAATTAAESKATAAAATASQSAADFATIQSGYLTAQASQPSTTAGVSPYKWPMPLFTQAQLIDARSCDLEALAASRYPLTPGNGASLSAAAPAPHTPCDYAVLAAAYAARLKPGEALSPDALDAYHQAVILNPAYSLADPLYYGYFGRAPLVEPPPHSKRTVRSANITYQVWGYSADLGIGDYTIFITDADTRPEYHGAIYENGVFTGTPSLRGGQVSSRTMSGYLSVNSVQNILTGLADLIPIQYNFETTRGFPMCKGRNQVFFVVTLYLDDGSSLLLKTDGRSYMRGGGPWSVTLDGITYMQASPALSNSINGLAIDLHLPFTPLDTRIVDPACNMIAGSSLLDSLYYREE